MHYSESALFYTFFNYPYNFKKFCALKHRAASMISHNDSFNLQHGPSYAIVSSGFAFWTHSISHLLGYVSPSEPQTSSSTAGHLQISSPSAKLEPMNRIKIAKIILILSSVGYGVSKTIVWCLDDFTFGIKCQNFCYLYEISIVLPHFRF